MLHNERLKPDDLAEAVIHQALGQVPRSGRVRFTLDWTSEADPHLRVNSLVVGRRAVPPLGGPIQRVCSKGGWRVMSGR
jgi:hypothetical protein